MGMAVESKFHVLAVDDSLFDRKLIERLLQKSSCQVTTVDSGSKALEFLGFESNEDPNVCSISPKTHKEVVEVNLIITDYCMPGMTGYDLLKKLKESSAYKNIPVVIMSSENVPARISRCLEEGAEEFFLKPVRLADINKLKPHMMKNQKLEEIRKPSEDEEHGTVESEMKETDIEVLPLQLVQQEEQHALSTNNKRKSMEEGISIDRSSRPRFDGISITTAV